MEEFLKKYWLWIAILLVVLLISHEHHQHKKKGGKKKAGEALRLKKAHQMYQQPIKPDTNSNPWYVDDDIQNPMGHGNWGPEDDSDDIAERIREAGEEVEEEESGMGAANFDGEGYDQFKDEDYPVAVAGIVDYQHFDIEEDEREYPTPYEEVNEAINA
jgi:hypothetical protein